MLSRENARIAKVLQLVIPCIDMSLSEGNYWQIGSCHQEQVEVPSRIPTRYVMV
jgi:hypothetical protein